MSLTHTGTQRIETRRLILRRFEYGDNVSMRRHWVSDPLVQKMYSEPTYETEQETAGLLSRYIEAYRAENCYRWTITLRDRPDSIGQIAYFLLNDSNHWGELEYCISREFQNRGYMTEAVAAIVEYGFHRINLHKVQVCHKSNNPASKRVIEKSGFVYEGTLRDYFFLDGEYVDRLYYSRIKGE